MSDGAGDEGFSTIEVLVAFSILSLGLALLLQTLGQSAGTTRAAKSALDEMETERRSIAEALYQAHGDGRGPWDGHGGRTMRHSLNSEIGKGTTLIIVRDPHGLADHLVIAPARQPLR